MSVFKPREWPTLPLPSTPVEVEAAVARFGGAAGFGAWIAVIV